MIRADASEVYKLAADLSMVGARSIPALRAGMATAGKAFETAWRNDAIQLHDTHAHFYPDSIDSELVFSLTSVAVEVGPNADKKQGFLGRILEFGGEHSPAYLTGLRALDRAEPAVEKAVTNAMDPLF